MCDKPAYLTGLHGEGGEVPCPVVFSTRGARSRTREYVEHPEARKHRWVRCITGRSSKLMRYAGSHGGTPRFAVRSRHPVRSAG